MNLDLTKGIGDAITGAIPQLTDAAKGAEASLAADLQGVEKTLSKGETDALQTFTSTVAEVKALLDRINGGSITATVTFNFPPK